MAPKHRQILQAKLANRSAETSTKLYAIGMQQCPNCKRVKPIEELIDRKCTGCNKRELPS